MMGRGNSLKILIITLITVTVTGVFAQGKTGFISGAFNLVPLGISNLTASAKSTPDSAENDELTRLKRENEELRAELIDYLDLQRENERLLKYFNISKQKPDLTLKPAVVIARDADDDFYSFTIGKGTADGVSEGNPVITENGLIGQVSRAEQYSSIVTTILSPKIQIGAYDSRSSDSGVISGMAELSLKNRTALTLLTEDNTIKEGDIITTQGTGGNYPKGLAVGKVKSVEYSEFDSSPYAVIEPYEDISRVVSALVVTDFSGRGEVALRD